MSIDVPGTEGYGKHADVLANDWRKISFEDCHRQVLHLIPKAPSRILDVGAGIGRDAAALALMGHAVVAVEPVDELRAAATNFYPASSVVWLDDSLPDLCLLAERTNTFDVVMATAVWMHLDLSLRHGPFPAGRRMFDVSAEDTIRLAEAHRLQLLLNVRSGSVQQANRDKGIVWTRLAFMK
ncbi:class I SAM-dependent methyltransferase [Burkholderia gladioli]|uniref:Methyltransferase type 11 n=1 Tax=Burkholderia gladioli (strain BSR3) TaxID=999541 RepID=F2L9U6_BURGS|nr:methyltransferase domain-containing protein [Burkholderia gladioli]AEA60093.1 Methyltransferase type 11 [Burkholderia gladioli BSR3]